MKSTDLPSAGPAAVGRPELLPAIDLRRGRVVRLEKGDDARRTEYDRDPRRLVERFAAAGATRIHVVDLDAAFGETPQRKLVEELAKASPVPLELGGGLRDADDVRWGLDAGVDRLVLGSVVAKDPAAFARLTEEFPHRLVPALEVKGDEIKIGGWTESAPLGVEALCAELHGLACPAILVTDVERDGMLSGPNLELARRVAEDTAIPALLSGGVRNLDDLRRAARCPELAGVIVGKALYEGVIDLDEALAAMNVLTKEEDA